MLVALSLRQASIGNSANGERRTVLRACVVDEDVDGADPGLDVGDARLHRVRVGDVESRGVHVETLLLQRALRLPQARRVARIEDQRRTG